MVCLKTIKTSKAKQACDQKKVRDHAPWTDFEPSSWWQFILERKLPYGLVSHSDPMWDGWSFLICFPRIRLLLLSKRAATREEDIAERPAFAHSGPSSWKMVRRIESTRSLIVFPIFHFNIYGALGLRWENPNSCNDTYGTEITLAHPSHEFRTSIWRNVVQVVGPNPIMQFQLPSIK